MGPGMGIDQPKTVGAAEPESLEHVEKMAHSLVRASNEMLSISRVMRTKLTGQPHIEDPNAKSEPREGRIPVMLSLLHDADRNIENSAAVLADVANLL